MTKKCIYIIYSVNIVKATGEEISRLLSFKFKSTFLYEIDVRFIDHENGTNETIYVQDKIFQTSSGNLKLWSHQNPFQDKYIEKCLRQQPG